MSRTGSNKRIAINTAVIYCRLIATLGLSLYSTRFVLEALGQADFGLYNVIAGVVSMFAFIAATMATTTQRFISYTMGAHGDTEHLRVVFGSSITIHALLSLGVALIVLFGGWWVIDHLLTIPAGKHQLAIFVLFTVCAGLVGTINSVPFEALLMAHENILFVSVCQVINAVVKFGGAIVLLYVDGERLKLYALIMAALPFLLYLFEAAFCLMRYPESRVRLRDMKPTLMMREFGKFAGWVMVGTTCTTLRSQGISIILNMFWGVVVNAANGVANQVNNTLQFFSTSITTSLRPQLIKSAGENDTRRMMTLIFASCKYPLLLVSLAGIPIIVAMPYILSIWLKQVPEYTCSFCRLMILGTMMRQSYMGLVAGMEAKGNVRNLHLTVGLLTISVVPAGYFLAKAGFDPQLIYWCQVASQLLCTVCLIYLAGREIGLPRGSLCRDVYLRCLAVIAVLFAADWGLWLLMPENVLSLVALLFVDIVVFAALLFSVGLTRGERGTVAGGLRKIKVVGKLFPAHKKTI